MEGLVFTDQKVQTSLIRRQAIQTINSNDLVFFLKGIDNSRPSLKRGFVDFKDETVFQFLNDLIKKEKKFVFVQKLPSEFWTITYDVEYVTSKELENTSDCLRAFLIGSFFSSGSMIVSKTRRWIEFRCRDKDTVTNLYNVLTTSKIESNIKLNSPFKVSIRKKLFVEDFLSFINLGHLALELMNDDVEMEMRKKEIGKENLYLNNDVKTIEAAQSQLKAITIIFASKNNEYSKLDEIVWKARLENPDFTLSELKNALAKNGYELSRSTIYRKLEKAKHFLSKKEV